MQNTAQIANTLKTKSIHLVEPQPNANCTSFLSTDNRQPYTDKTHSHLSTNRYSSHDVPTVETLDENNTQEYLLKRNGYSIRLVDSFNQRTKTNQFIKHRYASKGYLTENVSAFSCNPNQITFEASNKQHLFGTLTLTIDSNEGLLANKLYGGEIDTFRAKGRKVCELSKFASSPQCSSKEVFASLFHLAYIYAYVIHKTKDAFIEINPRHAFFYKRMLGFRQIGEERICERVNAPAVLLHLDLNYMNTQITSLAYRDNHKERSIYPYFLSQLEEKRLTNKIQYILTKQKSNNSLHKQQDLAVLKG